MTFTYAAAELYWGLTDRSHKPDSTQSAAFLSQAQDDYEIRIGGTPDSSDKLQNKLVMLYYMKYVLEWYRGELGYAETVSVPQSGSQSLPTLTQITKEIEEYESFTESSTTESSIDFGF